MTYALVSVVFAASVDNEGAGKFAPLPVGLVVLVDLIIGYRLTGASMNPARSLGPAIDTWGHFWLYIIGPLLGGLIAGVLWDLVFATRPKTSGKGKSGRNGLDEDKEGEDDGEDEESGGNGNDMAETASGKDFFGFEGKKKQQQQQNQKKKKNLAA